MKCGLPPCLHVPIATRDIVALRRYVGTPTQVASYKDVGAAFVVELHDFPDERDPTLPIWEVERIAGRELFHAPSALRVNQPVSAAIDRLSTKRRA